MICRVVYLGRRNGKGLVHLYSDDYDSYLIDQWTYFKGLEAALSTNDAYKRDLSTADLRRVVGNELMERVAVEAVPERYHSGFTHRTASEEDVILVLRGLMERYRIDQAVRSRSGAKRIPRRDGRIVNARRNDSSPAFRALDALCR